MNIKEARAECERWLKHVKSQEDMASDLQKLASDRRRGVCDAQESERRKIEIQGRFPTVYDASLLRDAVRVLLKNSK